MDGGAVDETPPGHGPSERRLSRGWRRAVQLADGRRRDSEIHGRRAEPDAEIEEHDIDQMLDAINEHRRRAGRREIGEELADELMRSTWDDRV